MHKRRRGVQIDCGQVGAHFQSGRLAWRLIILESVRFESASFLTLSCATGENFLSLRLEFEIRLHAAAQSSPLLLLAAATAGNEILSAWEQNKVPVAARASRSFAFCNVLPAGPRLRRSVALQDARGRQSGARLRGAREGGRKRKARAASL